MVKHYHAMGRADAIQKRPGRIRFPMGGKKKRHGANWEILLVATHAIVFPHFQVGHPIGPLYSTELTTPAMPCSTIRRRICGGAPKWLQLVLRAQPQVSGMGQQGAFFSSYVMSWSRADCQVVQKHVITAVPTCADWEIIIQVKGSHPVTVPERMP